MREENTDHMKKNGRVVLLTAKPETIYERVKDSDERPILNDHMNVEFISSLMVNEKSVMRQLRILRWQQMARM